MLKKIAAAVVALLVAVAILIAMRPTAYSVTRATAIAAPPEAVFDKEAYALLLELVCGLHSPILGETEVQAQFKTFASEAASAGRDTLGRLCQRVLRDAKYVRSTHLQGFGAHSYGALALRHFRGSRLAVIGAGALAAEAMD